MVPEQTLQRRGIHRVRTMLCTRLEDGWDLRFVQKQLGHEHASTTSIYSRVSSDFMNSALAEALFDGAPDGLRPKEETRA